MAAGGAELVVNLNASPYYAGRLRERETMLADARRARRRCRSSTSNLVGGQDELVFDGASLVFDAHGPARRAREAVRRGPARRRHRGRRPTVERALRSGARARVEPGSSSTPVREVYEALVLGTRDYVRKNGFTDVLIGLSGGIDSSLVAAIAVDALGAEHVHGRDACRRATRATDSVADAMALADRPRHPHVHRADRAGARRVRGRCSAPVFEGTAPDVAEENLQARIRGNVADDDLEQVRLDGAHDCGNKSEMATGYATLYGDMAGGFAVIKDVPEDARVRAVPRPQRARRSRRDPAGGDRQAAVGRAAPDQKDTDSLPRVRRARPDHRGLRRGRPVGRRAHRRAASTPSSRAASRAWSIATSTSGVRRRPACASRRKAFGKDRRLADHQPLARLSRRRRRDEPCRAVARRARPLLPELALIAATIAYGAHVRDRAERARRT